MTKRVISLVLAVVMLMLFGMTIGAENASFSDLSNSHWAYATIINLYNKGIINGMGDGTFQPDGLVTRAQFVKMIACALEYDIEGAEREVFADVNRGDWFYKYINAAAAHGLFRSDEDSRMFYPHDELKRGDAVKWIVNASGAEAEAENVFYDIDDNVTSHAAAIASKLELVTGYGDGTFIPYNTLTRAEAAALTDRLMNYVKNRFTPRRDAKNEIELRDSVIIAVSTDSVNVPISADARKKTVKFKNPDKTIEGLEEENILYFAPCENFPTGFLGKVVETWESEKGVTVMLEEPKIEEVIRSADISLKVSLPVERGNLKVYPAPASESGFTFDYDADADIEYEIEGRTIKVHPYGNSNAKLNYQTESYKKKEGFYSSLTMTLDALVDIQIEIPLLDKIEKFDVTANVVSDINAEVGYEGKASKEFVYNLPKQVIPVAGIFSFVIDSKLVAGVKGELSLNTQAGVRNDIGMEFNIDNGLVTHNNTDVTAKMEMQAEGSLEVGPRQEVELVLCGITIPKINIVLFEGVSLAELNADFGLGIEGELTAGGSMHITNNKIAFNETTEDKKHACYACIEGDEYIFFRGKVGLGEDAAELVSVFTDKKIEMETKEPNRNFGYWHFSSGKGYSDEFEFNKCPHYEYKATIKAVDENGDAVAGAIVTFNGEKYVADENGTVTIYLKNGTYEVSAVADGYETETVRLIVADEAINDTIAMKNKKYKVTINAVDENGSAVTGATVLFDGKCYITDKNGVVTAYAKKGKYDINAEAEGYEEGYAEITVNATDVTVNVTMKISTSSDIASFKFGMSGISTFIMTVKNDGTLWQEYITGYFNAEKIDDDVLEAYCSVWEDDFKDVYYIIKKDRSLWRKECGYKKETSTKLMENVKSFDICDISSIQRAFYALKTDGSLWCWGNSSVIPGTKSIIEKGEFVSINVNNAVKIAEDVKMVKGLYLVKNDYTLWEWGNGEYPVKIMDDVKYVSDYGYIIKTDNTLWTRGKGRFLGDGEDNNRHEFKEWQKIMDNVKKVVQNIALKRDGTVYTWGFIDQDTFPECPKTALTPVQIECNIKDIGAKEGFEYDGNMLMLKNDGTLWYYGYHHIDFHNIGSPMSYKPYKLYDPN